MMSHLRKSSNPNWRQFYVGIALYVVAVFLQAVLLEPTTFPTPLMVPLALVPMIPAVWGMSGWIKAIREMDELQRRIQIEGLLLSLGMTALITFSYGFLETYAGFSRLSMFFVWPVIGVFYGVGVALANRRYR